MLDTFLSSDAIFSVTRGRAACIQPTLESSFEEQSFDIRTIGFGQETTKILLKQSVGPQPHHRGEIMADIGTMKVEKLTIGRKGSQNRRTHPAAIASANVRVSSPPFLILAATCTAYGDLHIKQNQN